VGFAPTKKHGKGGGLRSPPFPLQQPVGIGHNPEGDPLLALAIEVIADLQPSLDQGARAFPHVSASLGWLPKDPHREKGRPLFVCIYSTA
jgi:hypothetical protein